MQDFRETYVSRSLTFCLETKKPWRQTPSKKKKAVVFTNVTANAYQSQLNAEFSKVCEIFKVRGIESLKYIREFHTQSVIVATFPRPETWCWTKRTVIGCLTCRSNMGGLWPMKAAIYSRSSAVSLKVWLRETKGRITLEFGLEVKFVKRVVATSWRKMISVTIQVLRYFRFVDRGVDHAEDAGDMCPPLTFNIT